jgi:hypothetical protein
MWQDNEDGTFTAEQGDTLWGLYGSDWQEKSGYTGDPTKLQVGETVGKKNTIRLATPENIFDITNSDLDSAYAWAFGTSYMPPDKPEYVNVDINMAMAKNMTPFTWRLYVQNKGPWDYKQIDGKYENFGNFNFGATGTALGFSPDLLLRGAGWASIKADPGRREIYGSPIGDKPYGDDPIDAFWIIQGINYARKKY